MYSRPFSNLGYNHSIYDYGFTKKNIFFSDVGFGWGFCYTGCIDFLFIF